MTKDELGQYIDKLDEKFEKNKPKRFFLALVIWLVVIFVLLRMLGIISIGTCLVMGIICFVVNCLISAFIFGKSIKETYYLENLKSEYQRMP